LAENKTSPQPAARPISQSLSLAGLLGFPGVLPEVGEPGPADTLRAQLRAKEFEIERLQQKLLVAEKKLRESISSLDDERHRRKLGESSGELAKSMQDMEEKNRTLKKRLQTSERESAAEFARLNAKIDWFNTLLNQCNQQQQAPQKLVGIGIRITDEPPHRVTEIVAGGAAHQSGEVAVGDYILEVGHIDVSHHPIETIRKNVLGPAGSYLDLKLDRRGENEESRVFTVTIKRSEIVPTGPQRYERVLGLVVCIY